jgi:hypothetical protein
MITRAIRISCASTISGISPQTFRGSTARNLNAHHAMSLMKKDAI